MLKSEAAAIGSEKAAEASLRRLEARPRWKCFRCGLERLATVHMMRQKYCTKECMAQDYATRMRGSDNPNYRDAAKKLCEQCGAPYKNYNKSSRFCSLGCRDRANDHLRTNAKKDANHQRVVDRLEAGGAKVIDTSRMMFGFPDLLVWHVKAWHTVEIKNPDTHYGRKGLNKQQEKWSKEWQGGPVYIIRTDEDVDTFLIGELSKLDQMGGYIPEALDALEQSK